MKEEREKEKKVLLKKKDIEGRSDSSSSSNRITQATLAREIGKKGGRNEEGGFKHNRGSIRNILKGKEKKRGDADSCNSFR